MGTTRAQADRRATSKTKSTSKTESKTTTRTDAARSPGAKPTAKKPTAKKPTAKKPTTKKPTAKKPTAKKPTKKPTTAKKPTTIAKANAPPRSSAKPRAKARARAVSPAASTSALHHEVDFPASPGVVWAYLVDPAKHAAFTGGKATGAAEVGAAFTAWDGYILGTHEELVPGERIVQSWSTTEWPEGAPPSRLEITLTPIRGGTRLTMLHSDVPTAQAAAYNEGWTQHYWEPLAAFLARGGA
jgi:uncharacterized protein YndB with AHSA1/START domain